MSNNLKYGKVAGIDLSLRDVSTERSEYVVENRDMLVKYARGLNIDFNSADDLVNDLWLSFRKNEADGVGYIEDGSEYLGYISVEVAVKSRLKLMAKNKAYARLSNNDKNVIANFTDDIDDDKDTWFNKIKDVAEQHGYAREVKEFKANPDAFPGHVGDVSTVIRVALTGRQNTPDMYEIMRVLGKDSVIARLEKGMM